MYEVYSIESIKEIQIFSIGVKSITITEIINGKQNIVDIKIYFARVIRDRLIEHLDNFNNHNRKKKFEMKPAIE